MDLVKHPDFPNPFTQQPELYRVKLFRKQQGIHDWIANHSHQIFTAKMIEKDFVDLGGCPYRNVRDLLRYLEKKDVLVRVGYGAYVTKQHYDSACKAIAHTCETGVGTEEFPPHV